MRDEIDIKFGLLAHRYLDDGTVLSVIPLFGGRARLCIGTNLYLYDDGW